MNGVAPRPIGRRGETHEVVEIMRSLLLGELLAPSSELYVITPWVTDVAVIDNHSHAFSSLDPAWGATQIRLTQVLGRLSELGSSVIVATHPHARVRMLGERLRQVVAPGVEPPLVIEDPDLGETGILADTFYLFGVLNLTEGGITAGEDGLVLHTDPVLLGQTHVRFRERWRNGGRW